jgi:hypothetical protein
MTLRQIEVASVHNHHFALLELLTLVFRTRNLFECIPVLIEACEVPADPGRCKLDVVEGDMCDHDCNERSATLHGKPHAAIAATKDAQWAYLTLRDVPYATDFTEPQR